MTCSDRKENLTADIKDTITLRKNNYLTQTTPTAHKDNSLHK